MHVVCAAGSCSVPMIPVPHIVGLVRCDMVWRMVAFLHTIQGDGGHARRAGRRPAHRGGHGYRQHHADHRGFQTSSTYGSRCSSRRHTVSITNPSPSPPSVPQSLPTITLRQQILPKCFQQMLPTCSIYIFVPYRPALSGGCPSACPCTRHELFFQSYSRTALTRPTCPPHAACTHAPYTRPYPCPSHLILVFSRQTDAASTLLPPSIFPCTASS